MKAMLCPRCGRQNEARAKFCASCGLNLSAAGIEPNGHIQRTSRRTGVWLVVILVLLGLGLAGFATCFRIATCPPRVRIAPPPPRLIPPIYEQPIHERHPRGEGEIIFYQRREVERDFAYPRRDTSPRIPTH